MCSYFQVWTKEMCDMTCLEVPSNGAVCFRLHNDRDQHTGNAPFLSPMSMEQFYNRVILIDKMLQFSMSSGLLMNLVFNKGQKGEFFLVNAIAKPWSGCRNKSS